LVWVICFISSTLVICFSVSDICDNYEATSALFSVKWWVAMAMNCNSEGIWKESLTIILRCYSYIVTLCKKEYDFGHLTECTQHKLDTSENISEIS
jgi:hypothetical protein